MPVYWFALSQVGHKDWGRAILIFFILHVLVYPASNGYNSYMDRDETPVGGLEKPLQPTRQLFWVTVGMDLLAIALGLIIDLFFVAGLAVYILASRAYSYRGIRLKKYPVIGYLTVVICQGALVYLLVFQGSHYPQEVRLSLEGVWEGMLISSLLLGGFYPLTQIYQHEADRKDGVRTLSLLLGYRGTFIFTAIVYLIAGVVLTHYFFNTLQDKEFYALATSMLPTLVYFTIWAVKVWNDPAQASFRNTMRMNLLASLCINAGFIAVLVIGS